MITFDLRKFAVALFVNAAMNASIGYAYAKSTGMPAVLVSSALVIKAIVEHIFCETIVSCVQNKNERKIAYLITEVFSLSINYQLFQRGIIGKKMALFFTAWNVIGAWQYIFPNDKLLTVKTQLAP